MIEREQQLLRAAKAKFSEIKPLWLMVSTFYVLEFGSRYVFCWKGRKCKQRWRMVGPIQNLSLMIGRIKDSECNYIHWFVSSIWWFLKTKTENQTKSHWFSLVWFGFRTEPETIGFISVWFGLDCRLNWSFLIRLHL